MLGSYQVKTACGIMVVDERRILDGWIYAQTVLLPIVERPASRLTAPMLTANGIIAFADGVELIGAKKRMRAMHALLGR